MPGFQRLSAWESPVILRGDQLIDDDFSGRCRRDLSPSSTSGSLVFATPKRNEGANKGGEIQHMIDARLADRKGQQQPLPSQVAVLPFPTENFHSFYDFGKHIGKGNFGIVRECFDRQTGRRAACKVFNKRKLALQGAREEIVREIALLQALAGHPNIVQLQGCFEDLEAVYLVMEYCNGGELYDRILVHGALPEREAASVFRQILSAIRFCHSRRILHRDIKPENVLLHRPSLEPASPSGQGFRDDGSISECSSDVSSDSPYSNRLKSFNQSADVEGVQVKLADFGLGLVLPPGRLASGCAGSRMYEAPEMLSGYRYGLKADMWSLGVVLYALLSGGLPFLEDSDAKLSRKIKEGRVEMKRSPWPSISDDAKHLVRRLLVVNPENRASAEDVANHPWLVRYCGRMRDTSGPLPSGGLSKVLPSLESWLSWASMPMGAPSPAGSSRPGSAAPSTRPPAILSSCSSPSGPSSCSSSYSDGWVPSSAAAQASASVNACYASPKGEADSTAGDFHDCVTPGPLSPATFSAAVTDGLQSGRKGNPWGRMEGHLSPLSLLSSGLASSRSSYRSAVFGSQRSDGAASEGGKRGGRKRLFGGRMRKFLVLFCCITPQAVEDDVEIKEKEGLSVSTATVKRPSVSVPKQRRPLRLPRGALVPCANNVPHTRLDASSAHWGQVLPQ